MQPLTRENYLQIDCIGLKCPLPVMRLEKAWRRGTPRALLMTDDPISIIDVPVFCQQNALKLVDVTENKNGIFHFLVDFTQPFDEQR